MKLYIKQRVFSWGKKFDIYDASGAVVYYCEGKVFTIGNKLRIFDLQGNELAYIEQEVFRLLPRYHIFIAGEHAATVIRKFSFFKHNFTYEKLNWDIKGDFFAYNYSIMSGENHVMDISKKWLSFGDSYELDINDRYNAILCLASAIVIDCVCHDGNKH